MPNAAMHVCQRPGCGALCVKRYCDRHLFADSRKLARQALDKKRGSSSKRGYNAHHRRWRTMVLARDPLCKINVLCDPMLPALSTHADHVVALSKGGTWELENGQGACDRCHSYKTATEDSTFIKKRAAGVSRDRSRRVV